MQELEYDVNDFSAQQSAAADRSLAVRFYSAPLKDEDKSTAAGRPIFVDTDMVEIRVRGDRNNIIQRPVRPDDHRRFREAWRAYKDQEKEKISGTPLNEWPIMAASLVEELKHLGFTTVEQLAEAHDGVCAKVAGLTTFKGKAKAWLELASGGAPLEKLSKALDDEKSKTAVLERQVADLGAKLAALTAAKK